MAPRIRILGTRGIPGRHGGFETFAEDLAPYLAARGWAVTVYCQEDGTAPVRESVWRGVRLVHISVSTPGAAGTIIFDWQCTLHAARESGLMLVLGYNTAVFGAWYRLKGMPHVLNMDGMEWKRKKYNWPERAWFYINEWLGVAVANHLVADHPVIAHRLMRQASARRVTMIPYGSRLVTDPDQAHIQNLGLTEHRYALVVARPEPENSTLEIVRAFSSAARSCKLVVLGNYRDSNRYEKSVRDAASEDVLFVGAIYDRDVLDALRYFARLYVHGHTVGGTNPALVEALGAGAPVLAHDNPFNRWVAGDAGLFFNSIESCSSQLTLLLGDTATSQLTALRQAARERHAMAFTLNATLADYEALLLQHVPAG